MIGLKRHTVQVVTYNPAWADLGADACKEIRLICQNLLVDVQHIGSTSVPDLPAKPILDIVAGMRTPEAIPEIVEHLTGIGYLYRRDDGDDGGHLFLRESSPDIRTIHLHVVDHNGNQWRNDLLFRDLLRQDAQLRKRYAELKQRLAAKLSNDRKTYTASKHDFIRGVLRSTSFIGALVRIQVDRPLGSRHPKHGFEYPITRNQLVMVLNTLAKKVTPPDSDSLLSLLK